MSVRQEPETQEDDDSGIESVVQPVATNAISAEKKYLFMFL